MQNLALELNAEYAELRNFIETSTPYELEKGLIDFSVADHAVPAIKESFPQYKEEQLLAQQLGFQEDEMQKTLSEEERQEVMKSLTVIRRNALNELKEAAYDLGCNAVIGVDFDYLTLDPQTANWNDGTTYQPYVFGVTANGNAVMIEKIEE